MHDKDHLHYQEMIDGTWAGKHSARGSTHMDGFPYRLVLIRVTAEDRKHIAWLDAAFGACTVRLGIYGERWKQYPKFAFYFKHQSDAMWFKLTCDYQLLQ